MDEMSDFTRYIGGAGAVTLGVAAVAGAYLWSSSQGTPMVDQAYLQQQSVPVPGVPHARMAALCKDGQLVDKYWNNVSTAYEAFQHGARQSDNGLCLGWREGNGKPYRWITYNDVLLRAASVGAGLICKGIPAGNDSHIGIYAKNSPNYVISEYGCHSYSMAIVPLYDTLGPDACTYIINQAEINVVFCDENDKAQNLLEHKKGTPGLRLIVMFKPVSDETRQLGEELGVELITLQQLEEAGDKNPVELQPPRPDDLYCICYTSGTTGDPKGAMITHRNLMAVASGLFVALGDTAMKPDDVLMSYLPLAHMYERVVEMMFLTVGGKIGYYQGNVKVLLEDVKELKPTFFPTVPRLLNRIYDKVMDTVNSSLVKKMLFRQALNSKMSSLSRGIIRKDTMWDKIAFKKVQESLGGNVRFISCGSAPLSAKIMDFIRCTTGAVVVEGYGQTEGTAVSTVQIPGDHLGGNVGPPLPCNWMKLVDVAEMGYYAENGEGEVCVKGPSIFSGYLKQPNRTAEAIDKDGWLHTGDIGRWLPNGALKIVDRKKNIFKLAQGEYIAPEKIENIYIRSPAICQMYVHGDSLQAFLVGIAVPDPEVIHKWVQTKLGIKGSIYELCSDQRVKNAVFEDMVAVGKKSGLHSFEQVKDILLYPEQFSVENGLLTPTFKTRRQDVLKKFACEIEAMYSKMS